MAIFDLKTYLQVNGQGGGSIQALGTAFGMPSCMLNLTDELLNLLPSPILNQIRGSAQSGSNRADDVLKAAFRKIRWLTGIIEIDTEDGIFRYVSDTSKNGIDRNEGGIVNTIGSFVGALGAAAGFAGRLYTNYQNISSQINSLSDCVKGYLDYLQYSGGNAANKRNELAQLNPQEFNDYIDSQFGAEKDSISLALDFKNQIDALIEMINSIILKRLRDPSLEPEFTGDYADLLNGTNLKITSLQPSSTEIFRLDFGPPKSTTGRFLLSIDGLYFDSQTSGIVPALLDIQSKEDKIVKGNKWRLEHDPNLGGRGKGISSSDLSLYVNTILDPSKIDESKYLRDHYKSDIFLNDIIGQKNKRLYDLSSQITELESGNAAQAIISNYQQSLLSENSKYLEKINKRKKQIELAIKLPSIYGKDISFDYGKIPVNDFSYLEGINFMLDIQKQKQMLLKQDDVSGVVLPVQSVFVDKKQGSNNISIDHLLISNDGTGSIVHDSSSVSSVDVTKYSITDIVSLNGLFAIYNYLQTTVEQASSTSQTLYNGLKERKDNNATLISDTSLSVYKRGLAIPYLRGITVNNQSSPSKVSSVGSFIRLPNTKDFNDLFYNLNGATFETWVYAPNITDASSFNDGSVSGLYRLILANENTGRKENTSAVGNILSMAKDNTDSTVKGLVMGFTRDRRITQNLAPSNIESANSSVISFFVAPTQSYDESSIGFINKSYYTDESCYGGNVWHNFSLNITDSSSGIALSAVGNGFAYLSISFSPKEDSIKLYLNATEIASSSLSEVFYTTPGDSAHIPSFKRNNSFAYLPTTINSDASINIRNGPQLDRYFTPWILGGGFTDGLQTGNFMGGEYGGIISGLKGYLGSTKFYNRPLTQDEILKNYNAQKVFFENISIEGLD